MTKCLVLGANGLIGSHICEELAKRGCFVRAFGRHWEPDNLKAAPKSIEKIKEDYLDAHAVRTALQGTNIVFHCIHTTRPTTSIKQPVLDAETNLLPSIRLFQGCVEEKVKKIVYLSSIAVYGEPKRVAVKEEDGMLPTSPYGVCKLAIEKYADYFNRTYGLEYVIIRPSATYGERQKVNTESGVVANFVHNAILKKPLTIYGDGSAIRDLTHASDIAQGTVEAAFRKTKSRIFNLGTGKGYSINEVAEKVEKIVGHPLLITHTKDGAGVSRLVCDITRAEKELQWKAKVSLDEGITRCFNAWKGALRQP